MNCSRPGSGARATGPPASTSRPPAATASAKRGSRTQTITNTCSHMATTNASGASRRRFLPTGRNGTRTNDVRVVTLRVARTPGSVRGAEPERNGEGSRRREPSRELACKPDSVVSSHPSVRPTWTSAGNLRTVLLGLASGGVCLAAVSPRRRCALTAPFHPCLCETHVKPRHRRCVSVALSRGFPRVGLPTTSPCDVRTFLDGLSVPPRLLGLHPQAYRQSGAEPRRVVSAAGRGGLARERDPHPACGAPRRRSPERRVARRAAPAHRRRTRSVPRLHRAAADRAGDRAVRGEVLPHADDHLIERAPPAPLRGGRRLMARVRTEGVAR